MPLSMPVVRKYLEEKYLNSRTKIYEIRDTSGSDFRGAMDVYKKSFPPEELADESVFVGRMKNDPNYRMFVAKKGKDVIGMTTAKVFPNFVMGCYVATDPSYRNRGLGKKFLGYLKRKFRNNTKGPLGFMAEVETADTLSPEKNAVAKRRMDYYRREFGAKFLKNVQYAQPSYSGGEPVKMGVTIFFQKKPWVIKGKDVKDALRSVYTEVYRLKPDDPLVKSLDNIPEEVSLE